MGLVSAANGSQIATINTEHSLTQQNAAVGVYVLVVDTANMQAGDDLSLRIKTICKSGGASMTAYTLNYTGVQAEPNKYSLPVPVDVEIICTLQQTAGTGRVYPWSLLRV